MDKNVVLHFFQSLPANFCPKYLSIGFFLSFVRSFLPNIHRICNISFCIRRVTKKANFLSTSRTHSIILASDEPREKKQNFLYFLFLYLLFTILYCLALNTFFSLCSSVFLSFCLSVFLSFCLSAFLSFSLSATSYFVFVRGGKSVRVLLSVPR